MTVDSAPAGAHAPGVEMTPNAFRTLTKALRDYRLEYRAARVAALTAARRYRSDRSGRNRLESEDRLAEVLSVRPFYFRAMRAVETATVVKGSAWSPAAAARRCKP
jgi:hypothetical protein